MGLLLLGVTILGMGALCVGSLLALAAGRRGLMALMLAAGGVWAAAYGAGLLAVSLSSRQEVLAPGSVKRFCGFYLDCHMGVSVVRVERDGPRAVITIRVSSDARRATMTPSPFDVTLISGGVRHQPRSLARLEVLDGLSPGGAFDTSVVFDVGDAPIDGTLLVRMGYPAERVIESVLIGDEDSFMHQKTLLALPAPESASGELPSSVPASRTHRR